jgi:hypothetical protein
VRRASNYHLSASCCCVSVDVTHTSFRLRGHRSGTLMCWIPGSADAQSGNDPMYLLRDRGRLGPMPHKTLGRPANSVSVVTGAVRWIRAAIATLGPLAGPLPALLLPLAAKLLPDIPGGRDRALDPVTTPSGCCHAETCVAYSVSSSNGTVILNG